MNQFWRRSVAAILTTLTLTTTIPAALGAGVEVNGTALDTSQGWITGGTSYVTLRACAKLAPYELSWDGQRAILTGKGLTMTAKPGDKYIMVNGQPIYVPEGVRTPDGKLTLPMRTVAQALGANLKWDKQTKIASLNTKNAQPTLTNMSQAEEDLYWLSRVISAESRGEPFQGQIAVGNVVLNRVKHPDYPNTIKEVVFDTRGCVQFEPVSNGTIYNKPTESSIQAAKQCLAGADAVGDCLFFFAPALSPGTWIVNNCEYVTTIGNHRFYR